MTNKSFESVTEFTYMGIIPMNTCFYGVHPDVWHVKDRSGLWFDSSCLVILWTLCIYRVKWM